MVEEAVTEKGFTGRFGAVFWRDLVVIYGSRANSFCSLLLADPNACVFDDRLRSLEPLERLPLPPFNSWRQLSTRRVCTRQNHTEATHGVSCSCFL